MAQPVHSAEHGWGGRMEPCSLPIHQQCSASSWPRVKRSENDRLASWPQWLFQLHHKSQLWMSHSRWLQCGVCTGGYSLHEDKLRPCWTHKPDQEKMPWGTDCSGDGTRCVFHIRTLTSVSLPSCYWKTSYRSVVQFRWDGGAGLKSENLWALSCKF